jgi:phosphopantetheine adenylyltransferase
MTISDVLLVNENSKLRYSNAVFMNDPQEGKLLIDCLDKLQEMDEDTINIKKSFYNVLEKEQTNFYLGSFIPVTEDHEDELIMWRTYGRDENQKEAAGCCLVIDTSFFDPNDFGHITVGINEENIMPQALYRVLYYDQRKMAFPQDSEEKKLQEHLKKLKNVLVGLLEMKKTEQSDYAKIYNYAIEKVLYLSLSELRYFFKSADFAYENELRVIQFATNKDVVKIDDQSNTLPRKVYIESSKHLLPHLKEIVLGPMVPHPERWMYLQKIMTDKGHDFKLRHSNCRFQ